MPELKQHAAAVVYYVLYDGSKGHTAGKGHVIKTPHDFLLVTEDRAEWEAWHECDHVDCPICPEDCEECGGDD